MGLNVKEKQKLAAEVSERYRAAGKKKYGEDVFVVIPRAGCMKGTFTMMSSDFNAPLDDF